MGKLIPFDSATCRANQDKFLDMLISGTLPYQRPSPRRTTPLSIKAGELLMLGCAIGDPSCEGIRDSWRFKAPVTVMSSDDLDQLSRTCHCTFHGSSTDLEAL